MRWPLAVLLTLAVPSGVCTGCAADRHYSQTELNALETREFAAGYDRTFDATVGALFDLGYLIRTSDKRGGVITAGAVQLKLDQVDRTRTLVRVSTSSRGQVRVDKETIDKVLQQIDRRLVTGDGVPPEPPRK